MKLAFMLLLAATMLTSVPALSQRDEFRALDQEQIAALVPSSTRFVQKFPEKMEVNVNDGGWLVEQVPHTVRGKDNIRYRRVFTVPTDSSRKYSWYMYLVGINDDVEIRVDGQLISRISAGMTPSLIRVPEQSSSKGSFSIEFIVRAAPPYLTRHLFAAAEYTGIVREMLMVGLPQVWCSDVRIRTLKTEPTAAIEARVTITSAALERLLADSTGRDQVALSKIGVSVESAIYPVDSELSGPLSTQVSDVEIERERTSVVTHTLDVSSPKLWSPSSPVLYQMVSRVLYNGVLIDEVRHLFGIRNVKVAALGGAPQIVLNGAAVSVKAVEYIQYFGDTGPRISYERLKSDVLQLKTLGVNTIRVKYAAPHPLLIDLCNRNGIMMIVDIPCYDIPARFVGESDVLVRMKNIASRYALLYEREPAVIAISVADGLDDSNPMVAAYYTEVNSVLRSASTKLLCKFNWLGTNSVVSQGFDFVGLKIDQKWIPGDALTAELRAVAEKSPSTLFLLSFGRAIQPGNLNGYEDPLSVEAQAEYLRRCFDVSRQAKFGGVLVWSFADYQSASPVLSTGAIDPDYCSSGLVDRFRRPRLAYSLLKSLFNEERPVQTNAGKFSDDTPLIFIAAGIALGLVLFVLTSRYRRFREYLSRSIVRPYNFYADIRDQRILSIVQTILLGLVISGSVGLVIANVLYALRMSTTLEFFLMVLVPSASARSFFDVIVWQPGVSFALFTVVAFLLLMSVAIILKLISGFVQSRIFFNDTVTIAIWCAVPMVLLLPLGLVLYKLVALSAGISWLLIISLILMMWVALRTLKAVSVVFDVSSSPVYIAGLLLLLIALGSIVGLYQWRYSVLDYISYFNSVLA